MSVRLRVTFLATLAMVVMLVVAGALVVGAHRRVLTESLEESLEGEVAALDALIRRGAVTAPLDPAGDDDTVSQVVGAGGEVMAASPRLEGAPALVPSPPAGSEDTRFVTLPEVGGDSTPYRVGSRRIGDGTLVAHVASPLDDIDDSVGALVGSLAVVLPAMAVVLAALVWVLVGRTLRPVEAIRTEVEAIDGGALDRRVPTPGTGDEIDRLARTMNAMLDRIEEATARQQRFAADAAHELRTPVTRMRTEVEVDLAHPEGADPAATLVSVAEELEGLSDLVDDLLLLARGDAGSTPVPDEVVDLGNIVLDEAGRIQGLVVDTASVSPARVRGDSRQLRRAVRNLVDNASRHAATTVVLSLGLDTDGDGAVLVVGDDGCGIPPEHRQDVFERFTRLDEARTSGGSGLGLAICRDIVVRHGGRVAAVDPGAAGGARFELRLPTAGPSSG